MSPGASRALMLVFGSIRLLLLMFALVIAKIVAISKNVIISKKMSEHKLQINEVGTVGERINKLVDHFCKGNKTAFGRAADIQSGVLAGIVGGRGSKPGFEILQKLLTAYPTVEPTWLLFGRGPMLLDGAAQPAGNNPTISPEDLLSINAIQKQTERMQRAFELVQHALGAVTDAALSPEQAKQLKKDFPDSFPSAE